MAAIHLKQLRHSYRAKPRDDVPADWALRGLDLQWADGGAYALLGPSGCGKTTLLNLISGLLQPTHGRVLFDERDVTAREPGERNIAQVFQFPVVYDTMSVFDNLAFPLRNRGIAAVEDDRRVREIAALLLENSPGSLIATKRLIAGFGFDSSGTRSASMAWCAGRSGSARAALTPGRSRLSPWRTSSPWTGRATRLHPPPGGRIPPVTCRL